MIATVVAGTAYLVVVAVVASLHNWDNLVVVAQGSPFHVERLSTFVTLGEVGNMREIITVRDPLQQTGSKGEMMIEVW